MATADDIYSSLKEIDSFAKQIERKYIPELEKQAETLYERAETYSRNDATEVANRINRFGKDLENSAEQLKEDMEDLRTEVETLAEPKNNISEGEWFQHIHNNLESEEMIIKELAEYSHGIGFMADQMEEVGEELTEEYGSEPDGLKNARSTLRELKNKIDAAAREFQNVEEAPQNTADSSELPDQEVYDALIGLNRFAKTMRGKGSSDNDYVGAFRRLAAATRKKSEMFKKEDHDKWAREIKQVSSDLETLAEDSEKDMKALQEETTTLLNAHQANGGKYRGLAWFKFIKRKSKEEEAVISELAQFHEELQRIAEEADQLYRQIADDYGGGPAELVQVNEVSLRITDKVMEAKNKFRTIERKAINAV